MWRTPLIVNLIGILTTSPPRTLKRHSRSALRANASEESTAGRDLTAEHRFIALDSKIFQSALSTGVKCDYLRVFSGNWRERLRVWECLTSALISNPLSLNGILQFISCRTEAVRMKTLQDGKPSPLSAAPHFEIACFFQFRCICRISGCLSCLCRL